MESGSDEQRYKRELEDFFSNHGGSTSREIFLVILPNICAILLTASIVALIGRKLHQNILILIEFILIIIPCVFCCTVLADYTHTIVIAMLIMTITNFLIIGLTSSCESKTNYFELITKCRSFITNFRALTNIITAICILAVDFRIFPRKFAKTEVYGYSLMDTGVGLFIISNALVAPETRDTYINQQCAINRKLSFLRVFSKNAKNCMKDSAALLILGLGRFFAVELSDYQRHITEYGVHWNFFITLAFVKIFTSTIASAINSKYSLLSGIWILAMHEYALSTKGLKEWVLGDAPRNDFVSANREGLVSVPGYVGLYFIGIALGRIINSTLHVNDNQTNKKVNDRIGIEGKLFGRIIAFEYNKSMILCIKLSLIAPHACGIMLICEYYFGISRRLANSGYCAWILTLTTAFLTLVLLVEILIDILIHMTEGNNVENKNNKNSKKEAKNRHVKFSESEEMDLNSGICKSPIIFEAINYNGLVFFLMCNLCTGIVNMCIRTLYVGNSQALQIIISYIAVNILIAVILHRHRIKIKL